MMESQELINERNALFEGFKSYFSRKAKRNIIAFIIFCLLAGLFIYSAVIGDMNRLLCIVISIILLVMGSHAMIWHPKLAKADDAQEFLTIYDKYRKIGNWINLTCVIFIFAIFIIDQVISKDIKRIILYSAFLVIWLISRPWQDPYKTDINRLRELVQQS